MSTIGVRTSGGLCVKPVSCASTVPSPPVASVPMKCLRFMVAGWVVAGWRNKRILARQPVVWYYLRHRRMNMRRPILLLGSALHGKQGWIAMLCLLCLASFAGAQLTTPQLEIHAPSNSNDWLRLRSSIHSNSLLTLEASTNLTGWNDIGTFHDALFNYPDTGADGMRQRFYRLHTVARAATNDWKNELLFPEDSFRSPGSGEIRWVKFAILLADPTRVYYQDSTKFPFHFEFATQRLAPFIGMNRTAFDAVSLRRTNQQVVLGTVLYPPGANFVEYGVQFVGLDPYTVDEIARWFELVKATVFAANGAGVFYMPVFEQQEMARTHAAEFAARNITLASIERWGAVNHVYSPGWAFGRLKFFPAGEIAAAFADG
jgi:hypothetical protein